MIIRRELAADVEGIHAVHADAFGREDEAKLVDALRAGDAWVPELSFVAMEAGDIVGHVVCSRARIGPAAVLGLGPLGVLTAWQRRGVGSALVHTVLGAADARDEPLVVLLGHTDYYPRFGFRPAGEFGVVAPVAEWGAHFQVRPLHAYDPSIRGEFAYAAPFREM